MKKAWTYTKNLFSSDPSRWPQWFKRYNDWLDKDGIWLLFVIFMLLAMYTAKMLVDRIEILEHRIRRVEEPAYKPRRDVALASDMINLEHVICFHNHINSGRDIYQNKQEAQDYNRR